MVLKIEQNTNWEVFSYSNRGRKYCKEVGSYKRIEDVVESMLTFLIKYPQIKQVDAKTFHAPDELLDIVA